MRISHLRTREPVNEIVSATLSKFWSARHGKDYVADFRSGGSKSNPAWICNAWLNIIFPPNVSRDAFEPIIREYSRSTVAWRRPLQSLYVQLATTRRLARVLGHGTMNLNRELPGQTDTIVVPGNHKLRILHRGRGCCFGLLKQDFSRGRFARELDARSAATALGIQVPELLKRNDEEGWFQEQYVSATPINRLSDPLEQQAAAILAAADLSSLIQNSSSSAATSEYLAARTSMAEKQINEITLIETRLRQSLLSLLDRLSQAVTSCSRDEFITASTHGDFQPANILVDGTRPWIIDWEYSDRRQANFDAITYLAAARSPIGLAQRIGSLVDSPTAEERELLDALNAPGIEWSKKRDREFAANVYWIEELCFHLLENDNPIFRTLNHGFHQFVRELEIWLG